MEKRDQGVGFVIDLTERKRADAALGESEQRFRDYAEIASDWLWETGPDHCFTKFSSSIHSPIISERHAGTWPQIVKKSQRNGASTGQFWKRVSLFAALDIEACRMERSCMSR